MFSDSRARKILIVAQYYHPDITAAAFRIKETADLLAARGHQVSVIAAVPHRGHVEAASAASIDDSRLRVTRIPIYPLSGRGKAEFLLHYTSFMLLSMLAAERVREDFDLVIASSPPLFVGVSGFVIARRRGARFLLDIRDLWPDSAVTVGQLKQDGYLYRWASRVERTLYKRADAISCVAEPMADEIVARSGRPRPVVVYNGVPAAYLDPDPDCDKTARNRLPDGFIHVVYIGNLGYCQHSELLLLAAKTVQNEGDTLFRFHLIGDGAERPALLREAEAAGLRNLSIPGPVSKREAMAVMRRADALFLQLKPDVTMEKTIPSKVFDYLAAGRPIIFGLAGEGRRILERSGGNLFFQSGSLPELLAQLRRFCANRSEYTGLAHENRELIRREFSRERQIDRLEECFQSLFPTSSS
ncbi:MAG: glycosyltransferase family 4 protein [Candidatus Riflebacteria bacterium]|nr:glycosyltransferase family 4 protein [Candidatus Riflebacteria bacterium]